MNSVKLKSEKLKSLLADSKKIDQNVTDEINLMMSIRRDFFKFILLNLVF